MRGKVAAAEMHAHANAVLQRPARSGRNLHHHIEAVTRAARLRRRDDIAPMDAGHWTHIVEIQCGARARSAQLHIAAMRLDTTNARRLTARLDQHRLTAVKLSSDERARHDRSSAGQREHAIDRESRLTDVT